MAGTPAIVNTVHGLYALPEDSLARRTAVYGLERTAAAFSHVELVQNEEDLAVLRRLRVPDDRLELLGNGIDLERFDPDRFTAEDAAWARRELGAGAANDVVVGTVGRLVIEKGYRELFAAVGTLPESVRVAVIGFDEPDKSDAVSADEIAAAKSAGVRFLGGRDDVDRLSTGMDIFVLASHREGFPRAAMEAAAMGVPIVATDIRGCRQVVAHGVTGLLVPPGDHARARIRDRAARRRSAASSPHVRRGARASRLACSISSGASTRRCPCTSVSCAGAGSRRRCATAR